MKSLVSFNLTQNKWQLDSVRFELEMDQLVCDKEINWSYWMSQTNFHLFTIYCLSSPSSLFSLLFLSFPHSPFLSYDQIKPHWYSIRNSFNIPTQSIEPMSSRFVICVDIFRNCSIRISLVVVLRSLSRRPPQIVVTIESMNFQFGNVYPGNKIDTTTKSQSNVA